MKKVPPMQLLAQRMQEEMAGARPALVDEACRRLLAEHDGAAAIATEAAADSGEVLALVSCRRVAESGRAEASGPDGLRLGRRAGAHVVAVMEAIDGALLETLPAEVEGITITRLITPVAVMDVAPEGLVIMELLEGVSATDVQALVRPTLKISPRVKQLLAKRRAARNDGG